MMFGLIKQVFLVLLRFSGSLASIVNTSNHIKCISLNNQQCMAQLTLANLHPIEYTEGLLGIKYSRMGQVKFVVDNL